MTAAASPHDTDVLIIGAGPSGLALARALADAQLRSIVLDEHIRKRGLEVLEIVGRVQPLQADRMLDRSTHAFVHVGVARANARSVGQRDLHVTVTEVVRLP